jgi:hypothetical protein
MYHWHAPEGFVLMSTEWKDLPERERAVAAVLNVTTGEWVIRSFSDIRKGDAFKLFVQHGYDGLPCEHNTHAVATEDAQHSDGQGWACLAEWNVAC